MRVDVHRVYAGMCTHVCLHAEARVHTGQLPQSHFSVSC